MRVSIAREMRRRPPALQIVTSRLPPVAETSASSQFLQQHFRVRVWSPPPGEFSTAFGDHAPTSYAEVLCPSATTPTAALYTPTKPWRGEARAARKWSIALLSCLERLLLPALARCLEEGVLKKKLS